MATFQLRLRLPADRESVCRKIFDESKPSAGADGHNGVHVFGRLRAPGLGE